MLNDMPLPQLKLNTVIPQGIVYTPMDFTPQELPNVNILAQSFAQNEARQKEAQQQKSAIDATLGKIEQELNPKEFEWFNSYKKQVKDNIAQFAAAGDYAGAINQAIDWAGKMQSDTEVIGRLKNSAEFNQEMARLDDMVAKGYIRKSTAEFYKRQNPYENKIVRDEQGNAIGTDKWTLSEQPVADLNINQFFEDVFKSVHPDTRSSQNATNLEYKAPHAKAGQAAYGRSGDFIIPSNMREEHASMVKKVTPEELLTQAREMLYANPDWEQQLRQLYGGAWQTYQDNIAKRDAAPIGSAERAMYDALISKEQEYFYTDGIPNNNNINTFSNYFDRMLFNSKQAQAYGYSITDYQNSYMYTAPTIQTDAGQGAFEQDITGSSQSNNPTEQPMIVGEYGGRQVAAHFQKQQSDKQSKRQ